MLFLWVLQAGPFGGRPGHHNWPPPRRPSGPNTYIVDNCSRTARLGTRQWGPRFQAAYEQIVLPRLGEPADPALVKDFLANPAHDALAAAAPALVKGFLADPARPMTPSPRPPSSVRPWISRSNLGR